MKNNNKNKKHKKRKKKSQIKSTNTYRFRDKHIDTHRNPPKHKFRKHNM